jgi:hypothetical protein
MLNYSLGASRSRNESGFFIQLNKCFSLCWIAGHSAVLHACTLEDESFVGMGATILDGAVVEKGAMVAAGSLVTQKTRIPSGQVYPFFYFLSFEVLEPVGEPTTLYLYVLYLRSVGT